MKPRRKPELLAFHGLVFRSRDPKSLAHTWRRLTGLETLRRSSREIVLGNPELFVSIRRGTVDRLEEVHLAVEELSTTRRKGNHDALGGDSWSRPVGASDLVVREFRRAPSKSWRRRRRPV